MGKVIKAVSAGLLVASAVSVASAQEIGKVEDLPNPSTGELIVELPTRPDGEKVYIVRGGELITAATVKSSGGQGGSVVAVPADKASAVKKGDRISLSPSLSKIIPDSDYRKSAQGDAFGALPGEKSLAAEAQIGAPGVSASVAVAAPAVVPAPKVGLSVSTASGVSTVAAVGGSSVEPATVKLTPRSTGVPLFPQPAVSGESGIIGPYGQGLAAAAPVGTPYLRSPAFAGPPIIYMPQTVTRVLLPGQTPAPSDIMAPKPYAYASAPFLRTDIYTSLPYGTYYWPQGYAGTTPVEPQVPAYVSAPATAIMTGAEGDYSTTRYDPRVASAETINPIESGRMTQSVGVSVPGTVTIPDSAAPAIAPAVAPPAITPAVNESLFSNEAAPGIQPFPIISEQTVPSVVPNLSTPTAPLSTPAPINGGSSFLPSLPQSAAAPASEIVIDNGTAGAVTLEPATGWEQSQDTAGSFQGTSVIATVDPAVAKKAVFHANIPADGAYEVSVWYLPGATQFRSATVPVTVNTAVGEQKVNLDQTDSSAAGKWKSLGVFDFKAGQNVNVLTISTEGIQPASPSVSVSVDAVKLVPQQ